MKIRSITTGFRLDCPVSLKKIARFAAFTLKAKQVFERAGYEVQTVRLTTQPWSAYLHYVSGKRLAGEVSAIEQTCIENGINFVNLGTVEQPGLIRSIPSLIATTKGLSLSATIALRKIGILDGSIEEAARAMKSISSMTKHGYGNFRFAAIANCPPHIPFYPASYHTGAPCFSIALESSDLIVRAFAGGGDLAAASRTLQRIMTSSLKRIERIALHIERKQRVRFCGIDTSPAPSLKKSESLVRAFEELLNERFGAPGTLSIARMITRVLRSIPVKKCGYCGLMLPVLEDHGLAHAFSEKRVTLDRLLTLSSVCGTGLDCVPLPGSISIRRLQVILQDVATLAVALDKPLSARLFPVPGKQAGQRTNFRSPYLMDCRLIDV
ncbi:DUF711 family protein [candidate division WOR-3 bacterium]|nr:DUF711 family protein [candidate division WOR-3 bacterium]